MNIEALPFLYEPEPRALNNAIAAFLGHKVVGLAPVVISGDNGEPFVADFGPENTLRGYAYVNPNWDRKDGIQDAETPRYHGVPECWLEVVPNYAKSMDTLAQWKLFLFSKPSWVSTECYNRYLGTFYALYYDYASVIEQHCHLYTPTEHWDCSCLRQYRTVYISKIAIETLWMLNNCAGNEPI